jgi:hypothetical protein
MSTWKAYGCPPGVARKELGDFPTRDLAAATVGMYVAMTGYRSELEGPSGHFERWGPRGLELQRGGPQPNRERTYDRAPWPGRIRQRTRERTYEREP